jgi:hypothetical protein
MHGTRGALRLVMRLRILATILAVSACNSSVEQEEASATATSALQAHNQSGITEGVLDIEGGLAPEPEDAAKAVTEKPTRGLQPDGCATKTRDGNVVTVTLKGCTGPFGKVTLDGALVATFTKTSPDVLHVAIAGSDDLTANGNALHYAADLDVAYDGSSRKLTYHGHSDGKTKRGIAFSRHTDLSIVADVDTKCVAIDGVSNGSIGKFDLDLTIDGFKGCRDACPTAGTAKATLRTSNRAIDIELSFDGSDSAHVKAPKHQFDVKLACDDAEAAE